MTMECNKDDALLAKKKAEERFLKQDFVGAKNFLNIAKRLFPSLEGLEQMLAVVDVHITAHTEVALNEMDWYAILQVDPSADDITIKKQYRKLALTLHPDKNKAFGAEAAFKLITEALGVLSDKGKRSLHDMKRNINNGPLDASTFWTACPICKIEYQYPGIYRNCELLCRLCRLSYVARDIDADGKSTHIWTQYYANIGTNVDAQRHCAHNGMANCAYTTTGQEQVRTHRTPGYDTACGAEFVYQTYKNVQSDKACKDKKEWEKQELRREKEAQKKAKEEEKRRETELKQREAQRKVKEEEKRRETELKRRTEGEAQKKAQEEEKRRETELKRRTEREAQKKARETELKRRTENEAQKKVKEEQKRRDAELKRRPEKKAQQKAKAEEKQRETKLKRRPGKDTQKKVKEEEKLLQRELKQRTGEEAEKKAMEEEKRLETQFIQRSEKGQRELQRSVKGRSRKRSKMFKNREEEKNAKEDDIEEHIDGECYTEETFKAQRRRSSRVRQDISYNLDGSDDDFDEFPAKKVPGINYKGLSNENANEHKRRKITINIGIVPNASSVGKSLSNGKIQNVQLDDNSDDDDNDNYHTSSKALEEALMLIKSRLLRVRLLLTFSEKPLGFSRIKVRGHCMT